MEILMNGQAVDFDLEGEKTLSDLGTAVSEWSAKRDLVFTGLFCDDSFMLAEELPDTSLDTIEVVDFQIQSRADLIIASLTEASSYCDRILEYIEDSKERGTFPMEDLEPFYAGIDWLLNVTRSVFGQLELDIESIRHLDRSIAEYLGDITQIATELKTIAKESDPEKVIAFLDKQKGIFELFKGVFKIALLSDNIKTMVIKSIDSPDSVVRSLIDSKNELPAQLDNLEKIAEAFQSGRDSDAAELLHLFLDFMYGLLRSAIQSAPVFGIDPDEVTVDGVSIDEKNNEINQLLAGVVEVMENEDIISAADILEYELKPSLEDIPAYIDILLEKIGA